MTFITVGEENISLPYDLEHSSTSGRSNGAQLVYARREMRNITNTGNKGIPDHICFCAMTISLELRGPTHISTVYWGPRPEPHVQVSPHVARPCFPRRYLFESNPDMSSYEKAKL
ncbi:hypothetical protein QYF36_020535 [Acer negundo]|nr:hypothetical protein QYF36_020535 [Acer negundo]